MRALAFTLLLGACAHQSTLHNPAPAMRCPIVVELPSTQSVDAVATLVADTKSLTYTPSDAVSVIQQRLGEFDHHGDAARRCQ